MAASFRHLTMITLFYMVIAWYFDNVISSNRGHSQPFYFFLKPSYWFQSCIRKYQKNKQSHLSNRKQSFTSIDIKGVNKSINTAQDEKNNIKMQENNNMPCEGLRIVNLSKTFYNNSFSSLFCGHRESDEVNALQNVFLEIQQGELLSIMGHNGAGKSTLINVLSGLLAPTGGNARIFDASLE